MGTKAAATCQHQTEEGSQCGRPALRRLRYCYFHQREHARAARRTAERARQRWFDSVALDDPNEVQRALREIMRRILSGQIEHKKAGQMLYKLQTVVMSSRDADQN
jgi:hypothetical protein